MIPTDFLIYIAPQLVLAASVLFVFIWGAKAKPPAFLEHAEQAEYENKDNEERY